MDGFYNKVDQNKPLKAVKNENVQNYREKQLHVMVCSRSHFLQQVSGSACVMLILATEWQTAIMLKLIVLRSANLLGHKIPNVFYFHV